MHKLAIIGNGEANQDYSDEIDACDEVIRFGRCHSIKKGNLGSKTTILALGEWEASIVGALTSANTLENCKLYKPEIWMMGTRGNYMDVAEIQKAFQSPYLRIIWIRQNSIFKSLFETIKFPTAGMMYLHFLQADESCRFKGWEKIIYGFTLTAIPGASRAHWKRVGKEWKDKCVHDFAAEGRLIRKWVRMGYYSIQPPTEKLFSKAML